MLLSSGIHYDHLMRVIQRRCAKQVVRKLDTISRIQHQELYTEQIFKLNYPEAIWFVCILLSIG